MLFLTKIKIAFESYKKIIKEEKNYRKFNSKLVSIFSSRKAAPMLAAPSALMSFRLEFHIHICIKQVWFIFARE